MGEPGLAALDAVLLGHFRFVRYDERGCGMSDWNVERLSSSSGTDDLEAVIDAARPQEPVTLLGISQGAPPASATRSATRSGSRS